MRKKKWIYTSGVTGERLAVKELLMRGDRSECLITVNTTTKKQKILGFGGAFTDTSAMALKNMRPELQQEALAAYFGPCSGGRM